MTEGPPFDLDGILKQLGPCGKFHVLNYGLMLIPVFLSGMYSSVYVFEASDISYRCKVEQCEALNHSEWLSNAVPLLKAEPAKCSRYAVRPNRSNVAACSAEAFDEAVQVKCDVIVYGTEDSAVKDFDLGCQDWKRTLIGTIRNSGLFICMPLTGVISDRFGRKTTLVLTTLLSGIFGFVRSFSVSYVMMLMMEFFESVIGAGINSTLFILAMELVSPKGRLVGSTVLNMVFSLGLISLPVFAWWLQDWRQLLRVIYAPAIIVMSLLWMLSESVRWLLTKGRNEEAAEILKKAAKMNNVDITEELNPLYKLQIYPESNQEGASEDNLKTIKVKHVLRSGIIRTRVCVCSFLWITCSFVYNGLGINSVSLAGNKYINFLLVAFMDVPGTILYLLVLDRFGRKNSLAVSFILSGCLCITLWSFPKDLRWLSLIIYLAGKLAIIVAYDVLYIYVSEVFPTGVRQSLFSICSSLGRVGSILAPMTPLLALYSEKLPAICFGTLALAASGMVLVLPETLNTSLPDTIGDAETMPTRNARK